MSKLDGPVDILREYGGAQAIVRPVREFDRRLDVFYA